MVEGLPGVPGRASAGVVERPLHWRWRSKPRDAPGRQAASAARPPRHAAYRCPPYAAGCGAQAPFRAAYRGANAPRRRHSPAKPPWVPHFHHHPLG